ncbi:MULTISPECIES: acetoacetate--CoA ligase [Rhodomicrobium]|uniref:acetoacetate--CoA ligase n=1 Tax=Rhodomicrobium TaxID=1068 RepID=UPI000B4A8F43|nr:MULTISPECIES: acetoacetate--CoA ligase [Rhodomicrobium]
MFDEKPLWVPGEDRIAASTLTAFMRYLSRHYGAYMADSPDLHAFSVRAPEVFWPALWDFCGIIGDKGAPPYILHADKMPGAQFFPAARLNFAENMLARPNGGDALVFWSEDKVKRRVSWEELNGLVSRFQQFLTAYGIGTGDRVAAMLPNMPEALAAMLAVTSLGAIWSSCSPDFGVQGALDRFGQIEPKLFISCDGYHYGGKEIRTAEKVRDIAAGLPGEPLTVIVPLLGEVDAAAATVGNAVSFEAALAPYAAGAIEYRRLPFQHPLYILFSSGTTGVPKCIVHSAGGILLQHLKEHQLHCGIKPGDKLFYFTTLGWMMWNWTVTGLASGATLLLYDGSPFHPGPEILFDYADAEGMNIFGTSAKYIDALKKAEARPRDTHRLNSVRMMTSTGSPLVAEGFDYVYDAIKPDIQLASVSGGTDLCACLVLGNPNLPVWRGEIQGPAFGLAVDVFSPDGKPMASGKGELVCTRPFPSMPVGFWNDPGDQKYHDAYFARFENIWHHGDFAEWTPHGGIIIHGRSDATLNPGGVRIGTAEIYRQVEKLEEVRESIVIGQDWDNDVRVVLFVVLRDGLELDDALMQKIKLQIRNGATPRHVPAKIIQVPDIPRTKSGKITEIAVRDLVHGREIKNKEALSNPEALDFYRGIAELRT